MANKTKPEESPEVKPTTHFYDLKGEPPDVKVGEPVTCIMTGKIVSVRSEDSKESGKRHSISVEHQDVKFMKCKKDNAEMENMDMDEYAKHRKKE